MSLPATFANNTTPTGQELDDNFAALGKLTPIPCAVAGSNTLALTAASNTPNITAYANYMQFTGAASQTNTGAVTAAVGSLAALNVYKDTVAGPHLLTGGEIVQNCAVVLMYDSALNSGAGGFHLVSRASTQVRNLSTTAGITITAINPQVGSLATVTLAGCSVADIISIGYPSAPSVGLVYTGYVTNAGTIVMSVFNAFASGATITPPSGLYRISAQGYSS